MAEQPTEPAPPLALAPIEAAEVGDHEDGEFDVSDWDGNSSNASTSITSSILQHSYENGRRYHHYRNGRYPIPNDDVEQSREGMKHALTMELTNGKLFFSPIGDSPQKIVDLGTGTGTWAMDVADQFPSAEIIGIDLSPIQPGWVPPNLKFIVDDVEDEWLHGDNYDLVHFRHLIPALKGIDKVCKMAYDHLKPGGWIESQDFGGEVLCDDGTMADDFAPKEFFDLCDKALAKFGMNFRSANTFGEKLKNAGFQNVTCTTLKAPIGTWPKDKVLRVAGWYMRTAVGDLMSAMAAKPFRAIGMEPVEIEVFLAGARKGIDDPSTHTYLNYRSWTGQKPLAPQERSVEQ